MEQVINNTPLTGEGVSIISHNGYWHLHRYFEGKHYFGFNDHRIGLSIHCEEPSKVRNWETREPSINKSFTDDSGKLIEYVDEPYTQSQIESFGKLSKEKLEAWVARGY